MTTHAKIAFRKLREAWFYNHLACYPHEREEEDADTKKTREENNIKMKKLFDSQTEEILNGINRVIDPTCEADMSYYLICKECGARRKPMKAYKVWVEVEEVDEDFDIFESISTHEVGSYATLEAAEKLFDKILEIGVDDVRKQGIN